MPTGAVKSYVAYLLLDGSILDVSDVSGKNNTLIRHNKQMQSLRLSVLWLKLYILDSECIECRVLHFIKGSTFYFKCLYFMF